MALGMLLQHLEQQLQLFHIKKLNAYTEKLFFVLMEIMQAELQHGGQ